MSAINPASFPHPGVKQNPAQQRAAQRAHEEFRLAVEHSGQFESIPDGNDSIQAASRAMAANMMSVVPRGGQTASGAHPRPNQTGPNRLDPTATGFGMPPVDSYTSPRLGQTGYQQIQDSRNPTTFGNFGPSASGNTGATFNHQLPALFPNPWAPQGYGAGMGYNTFSNAPQASVFGTATSPIVSQIGQAPSTQVPHNPQTRAVRGGYPPRNAGQHSDNEAAPASPSGGVYGYVRQYPDNAATPASSSGPPYGYVRQFPQNETAVANSSRGTYDYLSRGGSAVNRSGLRTHGPNQSGGARQSNEGLQTEFQQLSLSSQPRQN
jgi:hypothetical protein